MQVPLELSFRTMEHALEIADKVQRNVDKFEEFPPSRWTPS